MYKVKMKNKFLVASTGLALFSMFFGSGNLVFPIVVGKESEGHFLWAALGIILTGVVVPFLGAFGMMLYKGDTKDFFGCMGKAATFWFPLVALSLMGPFGVLARCITVAHGSFRLMFPDTTIVLFSAIACVVIYFVSVNKSKIVPLLGSILTPLLLASLVCIVFYGFQSGYFPHVETAGSLKALANGFFQGYQTMDLLAAFFFSTFVIAHLEKNASALQGGESSLKVFLKSAFVGAGLLSSVYAALVLLGSVYSQQLVDIPPQEMLGSIAQQALGPMAAPIVCVTVILACLTTAVVLTALFGEFLHKEVSNGKIPESLALAITLVIAFLVSTLEFSGIARFLGPILEAVYPALITLTLLNIGSKLWGWKTIRWPVVATFVAKLVGFGI